LLYLLDADTLIRADNLYYPLARFPVFWSGCVMLASMAA
jgi:hypothetical protein